MQLTDSARLGCCCKHTLRAGLQWSHALLNKYEQTTFRRLAVFAGGCCSHDLTLTLLEADLDNARAAMAWALLHDAAMAVALMRPLSLALKADGLAEAGPLWERTEACVSDGLPSSLRLQ